MDSAYGNSLQLLARQTYAPARSSANCIRLDDLTCDSVLDGAGPNFGGYGRHTRRGGAPRGRDKEDKLPESVIEERIQREKPCRTLFIRNVKASVHLSELRDGVI